MELIDKVILYGTIRPDKVMVSPYCVVLSFSAFIRSYLFLR